MKLLMFGPTAGKGTQAAALIHVPESSAHLLTGVGDADVTEADRGGDTKSTRNQQPPTGAPGCGATGVRRLIGDVGVGGETR